MTDLSISQYANDAAQQMKLHKKQQREHTTSKINLHHSKIKML